MAPRRSKKYSIDHIVPGIEFNQFRGGHSRSPLDGYPQIDLPHPRQVYSLFPGQIDTHEPEYDGYTSLPTNSHTPGLRLGSVEQPHAPHMPLYERGAQLFAIQDAQEQEMRLLSSRDIFSSLDTPSEPSGIEQTVHPLHRLTASDEISLAMEIQIQKTAPLAMDPDVSELLQQIIDTHFQANAATDMPAAFEQQVQIIENQMAAMEPPVAPEQTEAQQIFDEQMQQLMNGFGMMGPGMGMRQT